MAFSIIFCFKTIKDVLNRSEVGPIMFKIDEKIWSSDEVKILTIWNENSKLFYFLTNFRFLFLLLQSVLTWNLITYDLKGLKRCWIATTKAVAPTKSNKKFVSWKFLKNLCSSLEYFQAASIVCKWEKEWEYGVLLKEPVDTTNLVPMIENMTRSDWFLRQEAEQYRKNLKFQESLTLNGKCFSFNFDRNTYNFDTWDMLKN